MKKTIKGINVKVKIPEGKEFVGFYILKRGEENYTLFAQCDICPGMITTTGYEFVDVECI